MGMGKGSKTERNRGRSNGSLPVRDQDRECRYNFCIGRYVSVTAFDGKVRVI